MRSFSDPSALFICGDIRKCSYVIHVVLLCTMQLIIIVIQYSERGYTYIQLQRCISVCSTQPIDNYCVAHELLQ